MGYYSEMYLEIDNEYADKALNAFGTDEYMICAPHLVEKLNTTTVMV